MTVGESPYLPGKGGKLRRPTFWSASLVSPTTVGFRHKYASGNCERSASPSQTVPSSSGPQLPVCERLGAVPCLRYYASDSCVPTGKTLGPSGCSFIRPREAPRLAFHQKGPGSRVLAGRLHLRALPFTQGGLSGFCQELQIGRAHV